MQNQKAFHEIGLSHICRNILASKIKVKNPLDGCVYVYLDMGTNTGLQIRLVAQHINDLWFTTFVLFFTFYQGNYLSHSSIHVLKYFLFLINSLEKLKPETQVRYLFHIEDCDKALKFCFGPHISFLFLKYRV